MTKLKFKNKNVTFPSAKSLKINLSINVTSKTAKQKI